jgi:hypothetical protein
VKLGIMQPYFLPYIGYFQLIATVDKFVVYDNIQYTKKGWINRNRMLQHGSVNMFSISLAKGSDTLDVVERDIAHDFDREKLLRKFSGSYSKAPYYKDVLRLAEEIFLFEDRNLFNYISHSITLICKFMDIDTEIITSSDIPADLSLSSQDRVLSICKAMGAETYINPLGGRELYSKQAFSEMGLQLKFMKIRSVEYKQFDEAFVPMLSVLDVLVFNSKDETKRILEQFELSS